MNCNIFIALMQVICIVLASPVKKDGVDYQSPQSTYQEFPILIVKLQRSSESSSDETQEIPIEFPFNIAKSLDEILSLNQNSRTTEKPESDEGSTCPNTDIVTDAESTSTEEAKNFESYNGNEFERKPRSEKVKLKSINKSSSSVSMDSSPSESYEDVKVFKNIINRQNAKDELRKKKKYYGKDNDIFQNEITRDSKESGQLYEETIIRKEVEGEPVQGTLTIEKVNGDDIDKSLKTENANENNKKMSLSRILDVIGSPYYTFFI